MTVTAVSAPVFVLVDGTAVGKAPPANTSALPQSMVYAARYVTAVKQSGCEGSTGLWLDPLVPDVDVHYHEKRNAFPITVPVNETRVVWVDVFVPAAAQAGVYTSPITVSLATPATHAHAPSSWPVLQANLTVFNFKLPSTPPLVSMFGFRGYSGVKASHQASPKTAQKLVQLYILTGLANRITLGDWIAHGNSSDIQGAGNVTSLDTSKGWTVSNGNGDSNSDAPERWDRGDGGGSSSNGGGDGGGGRQQQQQQASSTFSNEFDSWAVAHAPLFDGIAVPGPNGTASLLGARLTSVQLPARNCSLRANRTGHVWNCTDADIEEQVAYWRSMHAAWKSRNWSNLLFDYTIDEPADFNNASLPIAWEVVKERVAWLKEANKGLRSLVTTQMPDAISANATNEIDIFVPLVNYMNVKPIAKHQATQNGNGFRKPPPSPFTKIPCWGNTTGDQKGLYANVTKHNRWSYQSCMSYGCGANSNCAELNKTKCNLGWASYAIDHSGVRNRAMEWASYVEDVGGELYYETAVMLNGEGGPDGQYGWSNALWYGGNGDGYLMYPGFANGTNASECNASNGTTGCEYAIGGVHDIPIESARLKHVRDGFEDNAWLRILDGLAGRTVVTTLIHPFMNCAWNFVNDPAALLSTRALVGEAIEVHMAAREAAAAVVRDAGDGVLALAPLPPLPRSYTPSDPRHTASAAALLNFLGNLTATPAALLFGHHNTNYEGQNFVDVGAIENRSDVLTSVGKFPGLVEYNFAWIDGSKPASTKDFTRHLRQALDQGAVPMLYWETGNPVTGGSAKDLAGSPITAILPGGSANGEWRRRMKTIAAFVRGVQTTTTDLPFIFRPFHENTGGWFWWGTAAANPAQYRAAFNYTVSYLRQQAGLRNMLIAYAPSKPAASPASADAAFGPSPVTSRYPGDSLVDVACFDNYGATDAFAADALVADAELVARFAAVHGKVPGICEFGRAKGVQNLNATSAGAWWTDQVLAPLLGSEAGRRMPFALTWRNSEPDSYWVPLPGQPSHPGFKAFAESPATLFAGDFVPPHRTSTTSLANASTSTMA